MRTRKKYNKVLEENVNRWDFCLARKQQKQEAEVLEKLKTKKNFSIRAA